MKSVRYPGFWMACAFAAGLGSAPTVPAAEPQYPSRPIRLIVASAPGGPNDIVARIAATPWGDLLGRVIGSSNHAVVRVLMGTEIAARAAPHGNAPLLAFPCPFTIGPPLPDQPPYAALKEFTPVSLAVSAPFVLLVTSVLPARSMKELV